MVIFFIFCVLFSLFVNIDLIYNYLRILDDVFQTRCKNKKFFDIYTRCLKNFSGIFKIPINIVKSII